jgi:hypothetical protein
MMFFELNIISNSGTNTEHNYTSLTNTQHDYNDTAILHSAIDALGRKSFTVTLGFVLLNVVKHNVVAPTRLL